VCKYPHIKEHDRAIAIGEAAIKKGEFAFFVVAGGQGSRLGFDGPKGLYPATPVMHKSLFELFAEKILAAQKRYDAKIHFYIMTSFANNNQTIDFFEKNNYFNLDSDKVHFFKQIGDLPSVDSSGKVLLKNKHEISCNPNGTAGLYASLVEGGMIKSMNDNGIKYLSYSNVDNSLANIIDPTFLGYHLMHDSEFSIKVIPKRSHDEPVGVFVKTNNTTHRILEYVNIPKHIAEKRDESGELYFKAASISVFLLNVGYIQRVFDNNLVDYSFAALKRIPYIDEHGKHIVPEKPNAYKFEAFAFDAMPHANYSLAFEVPRNEEFGPIKNAHGEDSPESAYKMQTELFKSWVIYSGISPTIIHHLKRLEISPIFAIDKEEFKSKISKDITRIEKELKDKEEYYFG
jgi:UDP-N-acetylglucosamine/UDP-N-acetylgalactosamine diphosphorylase